MRKRRQPRILFIDAENTPNVVFTWPGKLYDQRVLKVIKGWEFLSVAWRWQGKKQTHCLTREGRKDDRNIAQKMFRLFSRADLIVGHNVDGSDIPKARSKFGKYRLGQPGLLRTVDTLKVVRANYHLDSYSLEYVCEYFGLGRKVKHDGLDTWIDCMDGKPKAWKKMVKYNRHDAVLHELLYNFLKEQGHIPNHPALERIVNPKVKVSDRVCAYCGSTKLQRRGFDASATRIFRKMQCRSCMQWFRVATTRKETK